MIISFLVCLFDTILTKKENADVAQAMNTYKQSLIYHVQCLINALYNYIEMKYLDKSNTVCNKAGMEISTHPLIH